MTEEPIPSEHDEQLLELERSLQAAVRSLAVAERRLRITAGQKRLRGSWSLPDGSPGTLEAALELDALHPAVKTYLLAESAEAGLRMRIEMLETNYTGWTRYRLVISSDGHVHGDERCRSFRKTTKTVIIPPLSGKPPSAAVEMLGDACCSVCMPGTEGVQVKIPSSLVNVLVRKGTAAFQEALNRRKARAVR